MAGKLGIYAPLNRGEPTAMAVRLASALRRHGLATATSWLAPRAVRSVCAEWDDRVRLCRFRAARSAALLADWAKSCDLRVWFCCDLAALRIAKIAGCDAVDVLVPSLHLMGLADADAVSFYNAVLCSDLDVTAVLKKLPGVVVSGTNVRYLSWHSGLLRSNDAAVGNGSSALLYADAGVAASRVLDAASGILRQSPVSLQRLTLVLDDAPCRSWHRRLRELTAADSRLTCRLRVSLDDLPGLMRDHDWFIEASTRTCAGLRVAQALDLGRPVIAWDMRPFHGHKGCRTVGCRRMLSSLSAESAVWDTTALISRCASLLGSAQAYDEACRESRNRGNGTDQDFRIKLAGILEGC